MTASRPNESESAVAALLPSKRGSMSGFGGSPVLPFGTPLAGQIPFISSTPMRLFISALEPL
jgi:hypothetical protein